MLKRAALEIDRVVGESVEHAIAAHHRRRLQRSGWIDALHPPAGGWAARAPEPRDGNALEVLVDGADAFPRLVAAIRAARHSVDIASWHLDPDFVVERGERTTTVRELLVEAAAVARVRVLVWAGAPFPPARRGVKEVRDALRSSAPISVAMDSHARALHCHHEKCVVVDGETAFVGGIDMTYRSGDRYDSTAHNPGDGVGWHDATTSLRGPIVADVADHFNLRWAEVTGESHGPVHPPAPRGSVTAQLVRTIPERVYRRLPHGDFRILESYLRALSAARRFVYLENQYLWSPEIIEVLAGKLAHPPTADFRLLVVLPAKANTGTDDTLGQLAVLADADESGRRLLACAVYSTDSDQKPVYVHAKIGIVDDEWLTVGSANLNEHSLFNDSELNVVTHDAELARSTRLSLWAEHLQRDATEIDGDPIEVVDELWRTISADQLARSKKGLARTHRLSQLPHVSKRSKRIFGPIQGLLVDG